MWSVVIYLRNSKEIAMVIVDQSDSFHGSLWLSIPVVLGRLSVIGKNLDRKCALEKNSQLKVAIRTDDHRCIDAKNGSFWWKFFELLTSAWVQRQKFGAIPRASSRRRWSYWECRRLSAEWYFCQCNTYRQTIVPHREFSSTSHSLHQCDLRRR